MITWISYFRRSRQKRQLTRHLSNNIGRRISKLLFVLLTFVTLNAIGMMFFEQLTIEDALWMSFTTITTVGYGDISPSTTQGRITTVITMYCIGITLLPLLAAEVIEWKMGITERKRRGLWEWSTMQEHIQIINTPNDNTERYLARLVKQIQQTPEFGNSPIQLLTRKYPNGLPDSLQDLKIIHRTGSAENAQVLKKINLHLTHKIIILARDASSSLSDSVTFDILSQVVSINPKADVVVEAVLDENRERFFKLGAKAVLRPMRAYPEMIVRALAQPGTERVLEDLFNVEGDSLHRIDCKFSGLVWKDIVSACVEQGFGTPLGYFVGDRLVNHPDANNKCSGDSLVLLVKQDHDVKQEQLQSSVGLLAHD